MKHTLVSLAVAAAGSYIYMQRPQPAAVQPPSPVASTLPAGHHHSPEGVYYLRAAYAVPSASGPVQWTSGQTLYAERRTPTAGGSGDSVGVSDGTHSAQLLASMLSQDVEEGAALRAASAADAARMQARTAANLNLNRAQVLAPLAPPAANAYVSPLEQGSQPVRAGYYSPGYSTTVVTEVRRTHEIGEGRVHERFTPARGTATVPVRAAAGYRQ